MNLLDKTKDSGGIFAIFIYIKRITFRLAVLVREAKRVDSFIAWFKMMVRHLLQFSIPL